MPHGGGIDRRGHGDGRLPVGMTFRLERVRGVLKRQPPEVKVLDELALLGSAVQTNQLREHGTTTTAWLMSSPGRGR